MWEAILTFLKSLTLYTIVYPNELAVKTRGGRWRNSLDAGFYWQWPIYDCIWKVTTVNQVKEIPAQSIGQWFVSGVVEYDIADARKALFEVEDFDEKFLNLRLLGAMRLRHLDVLPLLVRTIASSLGLSFGSIRLNSILSEGIAILPD